MAVDLHPTQGNMSSLPTDPPVATTAVYRRQPAIFNQVGYATSYTSLGDNFIYASKPNYYQLAAWDEARRKEPIIRQALDYIINAVISRLGNYSHPNAQIDDFVQANLENKLKKWIRELLESALWSGFAVSEINWTKKIGPDGMPQTWLDELINFHPLQIHLVPNDYGVIKDGDIVTGQPYKSGVWVPMPPTEVGKPSSTKLDRVGNLIRLNRSKRVYITYKGDSNSIYGKSLIEAAVPWHLFKEAYRDMLTTALDRYGTPLIYVIVPPLDTKDTIQEPDGTVRSKTMQELTVEQMQNLSSDAALVFTQIDKNQPVQVGALTTGNNFSDAFTQAIELCDDNMTTSMGIPNLLMKDKVSNLGSGGSSERQMEMFNQLLDALFDYVVEPFTSQAIAQLIQYNFDARVYTEAYHPGSIQNKPARKSDLKVILDGIKDLTADGWLDPTNSTQANYVKDLLGFPLN